MQRWATSSSEMKRLQQSRRTRSDCTFVLNGPVLILTIQIDVAVNAPDSGTIKELLAKEEDTVTVGQDLVRLELGEASASSGGQEEAKSEPKAAASEEQPTSSDPEPKKEKKPSKSAKKEEPAEKPSKPSPPPSSPPPQKESKPKPQESTPPPSKSSDASPFGPREERRVCIESVL